MFGDQTRYRVEDHTSQLDMLSSASYEAIERAELTAKDIDCFIGATAVGPQPIPCTAALLHEIIAPDTDAFSFDVNSTCTSSLTALDIASRYIDSGKYKNILIASGDVGTRFLNPNHRESYELFSDAGVALVLSEAEDKTQGVLADMARTYPRHAHDTEIRGGLTNLPPQRYADSPPEEYLFDMQGRKILASMGRIVPALLKEFFGSSELSLEDIEVVVPHQASRALSAVMKWLEIPQDQYVDIVQSHGNMVSASVPFALSQQLESGRLKRGDKALLCGTAAGLTVNIIAIEI